MHMIMVIAAGIVTFGLFLLFGKLWGGNIEGMVLAAKAFIPVWLIISLVNMWVGVTKAGYTVREELPILLVVLLVPAIIASIALWKFLR